MRGLDYANKLFVCFAVLVLTFAFCDYSSADLNDGLVAYYPFNGNARDESGNFNDGSVNGATLTEDRFGNANSAYSFDGADDYINVPRSTHHEPSGSLTVSVWAYPKDLERWHQIITKRFSEKDDPWNSFMISTSNETENNKWQFTVSNGTEGSQTKLDSSSTIVPYQWTHIVGTYDGTIMTLYINGMPESTVLKTGNIGYSDLSLRIGMATTVFSSPPTFYGKTDDIRIYNRALTEEEIKCLYAEEYCSITCTDSDLDDYYAEEGCGTEVDCDDTDDTVNPEASEDCGADGTGNGKDDDCDDEIDEGCCTDSDEDGYYAEGGCGTEVDCNDNDATINPGIERDLYGDGIDDDCDGEIDEDAPFCNVVSVTPDDYFIGFGFLPRFRLVRIVGGGVDFDAEGDVVFSSDDIIVVGSRDISDTEISALIFITPRATTGRFDVSVGDCKGKRVIDLNKWWWN